MNPMKGLWRKGSEIEMKSRVVQLCINVSTWRMVAILELGRIQVKGGLLVLCLEYAGVGCLKMTNRQATKEAGSQRRKGLMPASQLQDAKD